MADGANVHNFAAIVEFQAYLGRFREDLSTRCDEIRFQFQRASAWFEGEASTYWRTAKLRAEQRFAETREALAICRAKVRADDYEGCSEQQKQFDKAKARLAICETKLKQLKACQLEWEQFAVQSQPRIAEAIDLVETRIPRARTELAKILTILEEYQQG